MIPRDFRITDSISVEEVTELLDEVTPDLTQIIERKVYNSRNEVSLEIANNRGCMICRSPCEAAVFSAMKGLTVTKFQDCIVFICSLRGCDTENMTITEIYEQI